MEKLQKLEDLEDQLEDLKNYGFDIEQLKNMLNGEEEKTDSENN